MPRAEVVVLGILEPSFDTQCRPSRYSARRHCAFLRQPLSKQKGCARQLSSGQNYALTWAGSLK